MSGDEEPIRAIVTDDDALSRRVIRDTLQAAGVTVIAEASNGREGGPSLRGRAADSGRGAADAVLGADHPGAHPLRRLHGITP